MRTPFSDEEDQPAERGRDERREPPAPPGVIEERPRSDPTAWDLMQPAGLGGPITKPEVPTPTVIRGRPLPVAEGEGAPPRPRTPSRPGRLPPTFDFPEDPSEALAEGAKPLVVSATWSSYSISQAPERSTSSSRDELAAVARQAEADGRYKDAALVLETLVEADPNPEQLRWLAQIYSERLGYHRLGRLRRRAADRLERRRRLERTLSSRGSRLVLVGLLGIAAAWAILGPSC